jgi:hypothetical protein
MASPGANIEVDEGTGSEYHPTPSQQSPLPLPLPLPVPHSPASLATSTLSRPTVLAALNLAIDLKHKLIVCEECRCAVAQSKLLSHFRVTHNSASKVTGDVFDKLTDLEVPEGPIPTPSDPVAPIQSITVVPGFKCTVPGCSHLTGAQNIASVQRNHFFYAHSGLRAEDFAQPCHLQEVYCHPRTYWQVDHLADTFAGCSPDARRVVEELMAADAVGLDDGRVHAPADIRLVRPFLRTFRWLEWIDDRDPVALEALVHVPTPQKDTEFQWLRSQLQCYASDALEKLKGLNVVALQIINTPKGQVIVLCSQCLSHILTTSHRDDPENTPFGPTQNKVTVQRYINTALCLMLFAIRLAPLEPDQMPIPVTFTDRQILATQALIDANQSLTGDGSEEHNSLIHEFLCAFFFEVHPNYDEIQDSEPIGVFVMLSSLEPGCKGSFESARSIVTYLGGVQWMMRLVGTVEVRERMQVTVYEDNAVRWGLYLYPQALF